MGEGFLKGLLNRYEAKGVSLTSSGSEEGQVRLLLPSEDRQYPRIGVGWWGGSLGVEAGNLWAQV